MADIQMHDFPPGSTLFSDTIVPCESGSTPTAYETQKFSLGQLIDNVTITQDGSFKYQVETAAIIDGTTIQETGGQAHVNTTDIVDGTTLSVTSNIASVLASGIVDGSTTIASSNKVVVNTGITDGTIPLIGTNKSTDLLKPYYSITPNCTTLQLGGGASSTYNVDLFNGFRFGNILVMFGEINGNISGSPTSPFIFSVDFPTINTAPLVYVGGNILPDSTFIDVGRQPFQSYFTITAGSVISGTWGASLILWAYLP